MDHHDLLQRFGRRVRSLRLERQVTQEELAHRVGRTVEMISFIERGLFPPSFKTIARLALALHVEPAELFRFDEQLDELPPIKSPDFSG